jgi:capsular exopolysaccharide synthesis family protein
MMTSQIQAKLITLTDPRNPVVEAFRTLRTNLEFSSLDHPVKTLVVTSPGDGEGKSTTLANLAVTTAQSERTVCLVDCDLRRPSLHQLFGLSNEVGLTSMIRDDSLRDAPPLQATPVPGLRVLTSGPLPPNPSELLGSRRMEEIIASLSRQSDIVLFDAPPITMVTDAAVLATKVDGVLLVVSAGHTRREHARRAKALLEKVNARLVGVVLNNVSFDAGLRGYYTADSAL